MVPGGGVEPPRPEGRRILSLGPSFRNPLRVNHFYILPFLGLAFRTVSVGLVMIRRAHFEHTQSTVARPGCAAKGGKIRATKPTMKKPTVSAGYALEIRPRHVVAQPQQSNLNAE